MAKLEWQELVTLREKDTVLVVNTASMRGRTVYSFRLGKLRPDDSIAPFVPVDFRLDDGAVRTGPVIAPVCQLFVQASEHIQAHADEADKARAAKLHERDTKRVERQAANSKTSVGSGLARFTTQPKPKKHRDDVARRQRDQAIGASMKGKKS
jgi:hypothetical protein